MYYPSDRKGALNGMPQFPRNYQSLKSIERGLGLLRQLNQVLYVVEAQQTDFRGDGGGVFHSDNLPSLKRKDGKTFPTKGRRTGRNMPPTGSNFDFNDFCETQYTIKPDEFVTDANAGLFVKNGIKWLITREKQTQSFLGDSGTWVKVLNDVTFADDTDEDNQMVDPWSASGHLYSNDGPGFFNLTLTTATEVVFRNRFQERVKMTFDGSSPIVSRLSNWHSRPQGPRKNDFSFRGALGAVPSKLWRVAARFSDCASIITLVGASRSSINRLKS